MSETPKTDALRALMAEIYEPDNAALDHMLEKYAELERETTRPEAARIPEGYKLLKDSTHDERSWPEDASHENGNYYCLCGECGRQFTGHKRRGLCKVCVVSPLARSQEEKS